MAEDDVSQFEAPASTQDRRTNIEIRTALANAYTFVRSREINKTISGFTFDHYIDEAKRYLKEGQALRSASSPTEGIGRRLSKMSLLEKVERDFNNAMTKARELAKQNDADSASEKL